ncbi:hypothetical protein OIU83_04065 [Flavobacterium sp. LS1R49]|uniref:Uncharacterized protein n=1 Tax=Flavobacterium shii TaxID=2987687 RepID=A0A9X2YTM2_9FLAO|nr:hypothetical protein [Flavobacterium shii]MCV9926808.1 hypothetical protein [Flavobacterium shii]
MISERNIATGTKSGDFAQHKVITGHGTFILEGADLIIQYETEANIPYDHKFNFENGTKTFITNI